MGDVVHNNLCKAKIRMQIDKVGKFIDYTTNIVHVYIPILLGLDLMKRLKWYVHEVTNEYCSNDGSSRSIRLRPKQGHLYLNWHSHVVLFTRQELVKLYSRFAHPPTEKLANVIRRASPENFTPSTRRFLDDIAAHCNSCQRMAPKPFVFQVTVPDNIVFNHDIYFDFVWI